MVKTAVDNYGKLDVLYCNVVTIEWEGVPLVGATFEMSDKVVDVNLNSVFIWNGVCYS